jgi:hypothetical protein
VTDVENLLRERLHDQLDGINPSTTTARQALQAGYRARRRRNAVVAAATAFALVAAGGIAVAVISRTPSSHDSVLPASALPERTVAYAHQFQTGDFAGIRADMTPSVRAQLPEQRLRSTWQEALDTLGPLVRVGPATLDAGTTTYLVPLHFRSGDANMRVTYDDNDEVIGITLLSAQVEQLRAVPSALAVEARQVVDDLANERFTAVRDRFDDQMRRLFSAGKIGSSWKAVAVTQHGGFVAAGGMSATKVLGATVVDVYCTMRRGELKVQIAFDDRGPISGLVLLEP